MNVSGQFSADLLKALGLGDVKNVYYLRVEVTPDQFPNIEIKCYGDPRTDERITRQYTVHERTVDSAVNNG